MGGTNAHAVGTPAGTVITNIVTATYRIGGVPAPPLFAVVTLRVDEVINVRVTPPAAVTTVVSPDSPRPLLFTLTNVGNGAEVFNLNVNYAVGGDQFDPVSTGTPLYEDNGDGVFGAGDIPVTQVTLNRDQSKRIWVFASTPAGQPDGAQGRVTLTAISATNGAAPGGIGAPPGTVLVAQGTSVSGGPVDAVVGAGAGGAGDSGAAAAATGIYQVSGFVVTIVKSVLTVTDALGVVCAVAPPPNSACFVPGAVVTYRLTVTVTSAGGSTALGVNVTDNVPANTTYVPGSIRVNGAARTDAADADNASCTGCGNASGTVTVFLGDVLGTAVGAVTTVDYRLTIN